MIQAAGGDRGEPGGRDPAPRRLRLVQDFVNTVDLEDDVDRFSTVEGLRSWLLARGLIVPEDEVGVEALRRAVRTREAIRALAMANNGRPLDHRVVEILNEIPAAAPPLIRFDSAGGAVLQPSPVGVASALSTILAAVYESMVEGTWRRLKACRRDACGWVFYDHSRNRSSTWCAMSICGNRIKTKAYYRRKMGS